MNPVLNVLLSHQPPSAVEKMLTYWGGRVRSESILLAYGGPRETFDTIDYQQKFYVEDPRLRTRDHQREFQSYTRLFQGAAEFLSAKGREFRFVHFAEYDHLPLVSDLNARQTERLAAEDADLLGFHLHRVDGTNNPHFLYHATNDQFAAFWSALSHRLDKEVILSMFGTGSFWKREAFCAVATVAEPFPIYLELYLPTVAHHLGLRVRDFADQDRFIRVLKDETGQIEQARKEGAWTLHPVKKLWTS